MMLGRTGHFEEAQRQLEASLRADPGFADAHQLLGDLLMAKKQARMRFHTIAKPFGSSPNPAVRILAWAWR